MFDNWATIFFAGLMSIWATLFLEGWKRYHAEIAYKWNVFDLESEKVRASGQNIEIYTKLGGGGQL